MQIEDQLSAAIPEALAGKRLDQALAQMYPDFSRSRLQKWIKSGFVMVDGEQPRTRDTVYGGELVEIALEIQEETQWQPENIPLSIVYEDEAILVVNKPAGLVVHPGAGNLHGTLSNALLYYAPELKAVPRAGIVHRLDKDTSGLLVVARNHQAHHSLVQQLGERSVKREYLAIVQGVLTAGGTVDEPIGRHPKNRLRMAVLDPMRPGGHTAKEAISHYRVESKFSFHTLVRVSLETGRTHQIRVHMAYLHHPLVGDPVYGGRFRRPAGCSDRLAQALQQFKRQALHATQLGLLHPQSGEPMLWQVQMPEDMQHLISLLENEHDFQ